MLDYLNSLPLISNCCKELVIENTDLCSFCLEHCEPILLSDYLYELEEEYYEDAKDQS